MLFGNSTRTGVPRAGWAVVGVLCMLGGTYEYVLGGTYDAARSVFALPMARGG